MTRRYRTVYAREFTAAAFVFGGLGLAYFVFIAVLVYTSSERPAAGRLAAISFPGVVLAVLGTVIYFRKRDWLDVDMEARVARFFGNGKERWSAPLDEFVALHVRPVRRKQYAEGEPRERLEYHVCAGSREIAIHNGATYLPVRRFAVRTARLWRIGLVPLDGRVRALTDLDTPLWRLHPHVDGAIGPKPPVSVAVEETPNGTTLRSARSLLGSEFPNILWLVAAGFAGLMLYDRPLSLFDLEMAADPREAAEQLGFLAVVVVALGRFAYEAWPMFLPAAIRVDARTVSYRGRRVPTRAVVEIVSAENIAIIAGDRRNLSIPSDFAATNEEAALIETLRALVARYGARSR
jgi:hypothetical protein